MDENKELNLIDLDTGEFLELNIKEGLKEGEEGVLVDKDGVSVGTVTYHESTWY